MHRGHRPVNLPSSLRDSKLVPTSLSPSQKLISGEREGFLYCRSVAQLCPTLCDSKDCRMPGFPVLHHLQILFRFMSIESVMPSNHLLCCPILLPPIFPSIRVFSNESALPHQVAKVLELQLQHQSSQWVFRVDFLYNWLVWSPWSPRDSVSFNMQQFEADYNLLVPNPKEK